MSLTYMRGFSLVLVCSYSANITGNAYKLTILI